MAAELIAENASLAALLREADLSTPVPTCPEWTLDQLMRHVGRGDRWCTEIVATRSAESIDPRTVSGGNPPVGRDGQISWLHEGPRAGWWIRRRLHETAVHRADAALALGAEFGIAPAVAADGITEYLERVVIRTGMVDTAPPLADGQSVHLHATDQGLGDAGEWMIVGRNGGIAFDHGHEKATVALRGPARDLLLALVRRGDASELGLQVFGDDAVWDTWLARTPF
jgi:hypothetical protein